MTKQGYSDNMEDFTEDLAKVQERVRQVDVDGVEYELRCTDPYGFWHIVGMKKNPELSGEYTSLRAAVAALENWSVANKNKPSIAKAVKDTK